MNARKLFKLLLILAALMTLSKAVKAVTTLAPDQIDLTPSHKSASPQYALQGKRITYTVVISNNTGPLPDTVLLYRHHPDRSFLRPGHSDCHNGHCL